MSWSFEAFRQLRQSLFYPKADLPIPDEALRGAGRSDPIVCNEEIANICGHSLGQPVRAVTPLSEQGTYHQLSRVELASGSRAIFRASAIPTLGRDYPLLLDAAVGEKLKANGLPMVQVHAVDLSRTRCNTDYSILQEAEGAPLKHFDGDEPRMLVLLGKLGRFLARLHQIRVAGFGLLDANTPLQGSQSSWRDYIHVKLENHIQFCENLQVIDASVADRIRVVFSACNGLLDSAPSALLHGDPGSHNVFANDDITCMIDWEDALSGDPVYEIAFWATFHPERRHAAFLNGYRSAAELPDDFEIRFWLYFLRVALAKTVVRHRLGLRDVPGREPASQRVMKALERFEKTSLGYASRI
jgi:aminoglycoside phosphotransferase (APT) family kinase protein